MIFRSPSVLDEVTEVFSIRDDIFLYFLRSHRRVNVPIDLRGGYEKILIPLKGSVKFSELHVYEKDVLYLPSTISRVNLEVANGSIIYVLGARVNESSAPAHSHYVKRLVDAECVDVGDALSRRRRCTLVREEDPSHRIIAGYTSCSPYSWGSFPPHRHDDKYEVFVYFDVDPGFGVQLVFSEDGEESYIVKNYDVVLVSKGYHPNISLSPSGLKYLWVMVAKKGIRKNSNLSIHPLFARKH